MENSSLAEGGAPAGKTSNGDLAGTKLLNGRKCVDSSLPPYYSGNSQGVVNGPASEVFPTNGRQQDLQEGHTDPKKTLVNGVCDLDRGDTSNAGTHFNRIIPNRIASKHFGNGEVPSPQKLQDTVQQPPPPQQDTAKAEPVERLANGPQMVCNKSSVELSNGPLGLNSAAVPMLRQQLVPNAAPTNITVNSHNPAGLRTVPANGGSGEGRAPKRPAEDDDRGNTTSGIPSKVGVRIITISDPNNAGSSSTMVAVPAGADPSTVAKVALESATHQRNCSPPQAASTMVSIIFVVKQYEPSILVRSLCKVSTLINKSKYM